MIIGDGEGLHPTIIVEFVFSNAISFRNRRANQLLRNSLSTDMLHAQLTSNEGLVRDKSAPLMRALPPKNTESEATRLSTYPQTLLTSHCLSSCATTIVSTVPKLGSELPYGSRIPVRFSELPYSLDTPRLAWPSLSIVL